MTTDIRLNAAALQVCLQIMSCLYMDQKEEALNLHLRLALFQNIYQ